MTGDELRLAAHLLDMASDTYSNFGCNDFDMTKVLPQNLRDELAREADEDQGFYSDHDGEGPDYRVQDWHAMSIMAARLRRLADRQNRYDDDY